MSFFDQYPYTNFHNVNLDWVLERVKEWGELVEQNNTAFHNLEDANTAFKNYVTSYLENLDVQVEINNKLDSMLESGVLTEYLQPYVSTSVTTWLDENITEPTGVVIDSSLTVAGACADSKAVGDRIEGFSDAFKEALLNCFLHVAWTVTNGLDYYNALENALYPRGTLIRGTELTWDAGYIDNSGELVNASGAFTSSYFGARNFRNYQIVAVSDAFNTRRMAFYTETHEFINRVLTENGEIPTNAVYARCTMGVQNSEMTEFDGRGVSISLT